MRQRDLLPARLDLEDYPTQLRRRISHRENLPPQIIVRYLRGVAGKCLVFNSKIHLGILDHILAPVFSLHFARGGVKASAIIQKAQFHGSSLAGCATDGRKIRDDTRSVF
jgi:hypothetical protein